MHRYQPRIHISYVDAGAHDLNNNVDAHTVAKSNLLTTKTFILPELRFIAVTAYQNQQVHIFASTHYLFHRSQN
jgi:hypothetical protein